MTFTHVFQKGGLIVDGVYNLIPLPLPPELKKGCNIAALKLIPVSILLSY